MTTRLRYDTGKLAIYDVTTAGVVDDDPLTDPTSHLDRIRYHSDLDYYMIGYEYHGTLSIPGTTTGLQANKPRNHLVTAHGLSSTPYGVMLLDGAQVPPFEPANFNVQTMRAIGLAVDSTNWWVREYAWVNLSSIGAQSFDIDVYLLIPAPTNTTTKLLDIDPTAGRVILGRGQIDTEQSYLKESDSPDFFMTAGRTIDSYRGTFQVYRPDGSTVTWGSYPGGFTPPPAYGVR